MTDVATLVPGPALLPDVLPTDRLNVRAKPVRDLRDQLRHFSNARNAVTVIGALVQSFGVVIAAGVINTWWAYVLAFFLMARGHVCLNILGHEAAHRLLFTNQRANDFVGRWMLGYPTFQALLAYRRAHFAHHRDELGPDEPDLGLYAGYPISPASWRRKLTRDLTGQSAYKNFRGIYHGARRGPGEPRLIIGVQLVMLGASLVAQRPLMYLVWIASWSTLWKFSNRLRAIAEHGGMVRSKDRRLTTHVIHQSRLARFWMVPYNTGWHLAHHVDMGVPWRNLPKLHDELVSSGWVVPGIEYPSYRAFWRACSSGVDASDAARSGSSLGLERAE
jgi:fatty acid desaturase